MKTEITNLETLNVNAETVSGFLNNLLYSDCESYVLYNVNGNKAMAAHVERDGFKPEWDGCYCTNNSDQRFSPVKVIGNPFEVVKFRGKWGYWDYDFVGGMTPTKWINEEGYKVGDIYDNTLVVDWGGDYVRFARLTKSGKPARKFYKIAAEIHDFSASFHDYNF